MPAVAYVRKIRVIYLNINKLLQKNGRKVFKAFFMGCSLQKTRKPILLQLLLAW